MKISVSLVLINVAVLLTLVESQAGRLIVKHACEHDSNDTINLCCPRGAAIRILYSVYGRLESNVCPSGGDTNCRSASSFRKTSRLCDGKNSCQVTASNSVFGDPCKGTRKYLETVYECVYS